MTRAGFGGLAALIALSLAGCSSGSSHSSAAPLPSTTTVATPATDATTTPPTTGESTSVTVARPRPTTPPTTVASSAGPSDQSIVDGLALTAADLPGQWASGAIHQQDNSGDSDIAKCLGIPNSDPQQTAYAGSHKFTRPNYQAYSSASIYKTASVVQSDVSGLAKPQLTGCFETALKASLDGADVHMSKLPLPAPAHSLAGVRLSGLASQGAHRLGFDVIEVAKGRIELTIAVFGLTGAVPTGLVNLITAAIVPRLEATNT